MVFIKIVEIIDKIRSYTYESETKLAKKHIGKAEQALILKMASDGVSIRKMLAELQISHMAFYDFLRSNTPFKKQYMMAREIGLETLADDLIDMSDDETKDVQRLKLKADNTKWLLSKRKAEVYGDRVDVNINKTVDISGALEQARSRLKDVTPKPQEIEDPETIAVENIPDIFD